MMYFLIGKYIYYFLVRYFFFQMAICMALNEYQKTALNNIPMNKQMKFKEEKKNSGFKRKKRSRFQENSNYS